MKKISLIIAFFLFTPIIVYAKPTGEIIQKRTDEIYKICQGNNLIIKDGAIINTTTKEPLTSTPWPWKKEDLAGIVEALGNGEPYRNYTNYRNDCSLGENTYYVQSGDMIDGCQILKCAAHSLDISDTKYFLDGVEISPPQDVQNIAVNNQGNLVQGASNDEITQNLNIGLTNENFWLSYVYPALSSIILSLISHLLIYPHSKQGLRIKTILFSTAVMALVMYLIVFFIKLLI